jgi:ATP-dependent Lon protease
MDKGGNKQTDQFQKQLDGIKNMPDKIRKIVQDEIKSLETESEQEMGKKVQYLNHIFRLPWDDRVEPYWDVQHSREVLDDSHYGMDETKQRILEFIAKNKRINSKKGMVLLLTGPPGVGKTTIAKSIGK